MVNMNDKSKVKNLASWNVSWERINSPGDELIKANGTIYISNSEIETQIQNGNRYFIGTGNGNHARVYIENPEFREYLGFDNKEEKITQFILDEERCKQIFDYKTLVTFKKHLEDDIITNQEKSTIINYARKIKLNDYEKIQALQDHCEITF